MPRSRLLFVARRDNVQPDPHATFELLGLRPVILANLGSDAIILLRSKLILIDAEADLEVIAGRALSIAAARESGRWPDRQSPHQ